ncbi:hypothetical protein L596_027869 [Steinernema carpocapsae]|uniref:Uncharacterized protein n=1 Tax=Steinernema carpocapsae TaxID=34508 RepID=A0A4U5LWU3_STECR|nr:hypothetical protein L596_027869 [Steinernema carpocapsae]
MRPLPFLEIALKKICTSFRFNSNEYDPKHFQEYVLCFWADWVQNKESSVDRFFREKQKELHIIDELRSKVDWVRVENIPKKARHAIPKYVGDTSDTNIKKTVLRLLGYFFTWSLWPTHLTTNL